MLRTETIWGEYPREQNMTGDREIHEMKTGGTSAGQGQPRDYSTHTLPAYNHACYSTMRDESTTGSCTAYFSLKVVGARGYGSYLSLSG